MSVAKFSVLAYVWSCGRMDVGWWCWGCGVGVVSGKGIPPSRWERHGHHMRERVGDSIPTSTWVQEQDPRKSEQVWFQCWNSLALWIVRNLLKERGAKEICVVWQKVEKTRREVFLRVWIPVSRWGGVTTLACLAQFIERNQKSKMSFLPRDEGISPKQVTVLQKYGI